MVFLLFFLLLLLLLFSIPFVNYPPSFFSQFRALSRRKARRKAKQADAFTHRKTVTCNIGDQPTGPAKMRRKAEKGGGDGGEGKGGREVVSCLHLPPWQMNPFVSTRRVIRCVAGGQRAEELNLTESDKKQGGGGKGCKSRALHSLIRSSTDCRRLTRRIVMADLRREITPDGRIPVSIHYF